MPQQPAPLIENNFSQGYVSEFTGLNFTPNSVQDTRNCVFNRLGNVTRRPGFDYELNHQFNDIDRTSRAVSYYVWRNAGGLGTTTLLALQVGTIILFYSISSATVSFPLSHSQLLSYIDLVALNGYTAGLDGGIECQFADGNGYLFIFHENCDPLYVTYASGTVLANRIDMKIRDLAGIPDNIPDDFRPVASFTTVEHLYNLLNQGWGSESPGWSATSTSVNDSSTGTKTFAIQTGAVIIAGQAVTIIGNVTGDKKKPSTVSMGGNVVSYNGISGALVVSVTHTDFGGITGIAYWAINHVDDNHLGNFISVSGVKYPSNSDIWWAFKDSTGTYNPGATIGSVMLANAPAAKGHFILSPFIQSRNTVAGGIGTLSEITTAARPTTGCWFAGRLWYSGINASQNAIGDAPFYTWTENIYFSQIVQRPDQLGKCHQINDPTAEDRFDLLPSDGGVISIQGSGPIHKLFPIQNGILVFAEAGIWFVTGSQGIGFAANDYTIVKISSIQTLSATSFVDVQGFPMWWNTEAIYTIVPRREANASSPAQSSGSYGPSRGSLGNLSFTVETLSFTSIQALYDAIPRFSKRYARGAFDPISWQVRWIFKFVPETDIQDRYNFDAVLTFNVMTRAFSIWTITSTEEKGPWVSGVFFNQPPPQSDVDPSFKYVTFWRPVGNDFAAEPYQQTFSEETDTINWVDWNTFSADLGVPILDYTSYFTSTYQISGQGIHKFQNNYVYLFLGNSLYAILPLPGGGTLSVGDANGSSYKFQGIWDYAGKGDGTGKFTPIEAVVDTGRTDSSLYDFVIKRHKVGGRGLVSQFKISSITAKPFDILGWAVDQRVNTGV